MSNKRSMGFGAMGPMDKKKMMIIAAVVLVVLMMMGGGYYLYTKSGKSKFGEGNFLDKIGNILNKPTGQTTDPNKEL